MPPCGFLMRYLGEITWATWCETCCDCNPMRAVFILARSYLYSTSTFNGRILVGHRPLYRVRLSLEWWRKLITSECFTWNIRYRLCLYSRVCINTAIYWAWSLGGWPSYCSIDNSLVRVASASKSCRQYKSRNLIEHAFRAMSALAEQ